MRFRSGLLLFVFAAITVTFPVKAQDSTDHKVLLWSFSGQFWTFDETTEEITEFYKYEPKLGQIYSVFATSNHIYFIEARGTSGFFVPNYDNQIIRIDTKTGNADILFQRQNIILLQPSEDERFAAVAYFAPHLKRLYGYSPLYICVLNLEDGDCREVNLPEQQNWIVWANNQQFIVSGTSSYLVNFESLEVEALPFVVHNAVSTPTSQDIFVSIDPNPPEYSSRLGYFNLNNRQFQPYPLPPEFSEVENRDYIFNLRLSPDEKYLAFEYGHEYKILSIKTREVIATLDYHFFYDPQWLNNGENLLLRYFPQPGNYPQQIVKYDVANQETTVISSFDEEVFIAKIQ